MRLSVTTYSHSEETYSGFFYPQGTWWWFWWQEKEGNNNFFYSSFKELCLSSHVGHGHCVHWAHLEILEMLQNLEWPSNGCFIRWAERSSERVRPSSKSRWRPSSTICLVVAFQRQPRPMSGGKTSVTMLRLTTIIISTVQPWLLRLGSIYWR